MKKKKKKLIKAKHKYNQHLMEKIKDLTKNIEKLEVEKKKLEEFYKKQIDELQKANEELKESLQEQKRKEKLTWKNFKNNIRDVLRKDLEEKNSSFFGRLW